MTLDEARAQLGVTHAATVDEIRDAFRRRARALHPDLHPDAEPTDRARLGREFNNAREARDILVRYTSDPLRKPMPQRAEEAPPTAPAGNKADSSSRTSTPAAAPSRVTMRFEEFVAWTDAAGFGKGGARSARYVDWTRIIVWSTLGLMVAGFVAWALAYSALV